MSTEFVKRLDDVVREELSFLGYEYPSLIVAIEEGRKSEGAMVRFHPPYDDLVIDEPEKDVSVEAFAARIRRLLRVTIEAPERTPSGERD